MTPKLLLGAHMPVSGGLAKAVERIQSVGGTALQIFTRNQRQWAEPELDEATVRDFAEAWKAWGPYPVAVHDSYLPNLASPDPELRERSILHTAAEIKRAARLGVPWIVTHPGAFKEGGRDEGVRRYASGLDAALDKVEDATVMMLLENTAGAGTLLGGNFEDLAGIMGRSRHQDRIGVCLDTCHALAAGYGLEDAAALDRTLKALDGAVGLDRLKLLHLNDSKHPKGSNRDRHEHIGEGAIGLAGFRAVMAHPSLRALPMIIETPKGKGKTLLDADKKNLQRLRRLWKEGFRENDP
ncbi:MAG: deoxyribonuclease IV [Desulfovibrionaceae bacterium]